MTERQPVEVVLRFPSKRVKAKERAAIEAQFREAGVVVRSEVPPGAARGLGPDSIPMIAELLLHVGEGALGELITLTTWHLLTKAIRFAATKYRSLALRVNAPGKPTVTYVIDPNQASNLVEAVMDTIPADYDSLDLSVKVTVTRIHTSGAEHWEDMQTAELNRSLRNELRGQR
jgi:hypothetical protein